MSKTLEYLVKNFDKNYEACNMDKIILNVSFFLKKLWKLLTKENVINVEYYFANPTTND